MAVPAALTKAQAAEGDIDVNELVFGHIGDAYQWHIAKFGDTEVSIPLPVIVKSSTGWHVFSSARLEEGPYEGLYVAEGGAYDGKIVERNAAGEEVRPLDISITKNVLSVPCWNRVCRLSHHRPRWQTAKIRWHPVQRL